MVLVVHLKFKVSAEESGLSLDPSFPSGVCFWGFSRFCWCSLCCWLVLKSSHLFLGQTEFEIVFNVLHTRFLLLEYYSLTDSGVSAEIYSDRSFDVWTEQSEVLAKNYGPDIFQHWPSKQLVRASLYDSHMKYAMFGLNWRNTVRGTNQLDFRISGPRRSVSHGHIIMSVTGNSNWIQYNLEWARGEVYILEHKV